MSTKKGEGKDTEVYCKIEDTEGHDMRITFRGNRVGITACSNTRSWKLEVVNINELIYHKQCHVHPSLVNSTELTNKLNHSFTCGK